MPPKPKVFWYRVGALKAEWEHQKLPSFKTHELEKDLAMFFPSFGASGSFIHHVYGQEGEVVTTF